MKITVPYGSEERSFNLLKGQLEVLTPNKVESASDEMKEIERAIDNPIGSRKLEEIVGDNKSICIICDDISRPTPVEKVLSILLKRLEAAGVSDDKIKIVIALGSHRYMTEEEMRKKVGNKIYERYRVINHEFRDKSKLVNLGEAPGGVTIWANKEVMDSDIRIGIGSIVPHPAVGWSGGGKIIYPGVTGEDTVSQFHIRQGMSHDNMVGREDCPLRLEMEKWVDTVGLHFIINLILTSDKKVYKAVAGHYVNAQREGVKYSKEVYGVKVSQLVDIAIVSSYPAEADMWQSAKAITAADRIVKDGGTIIMLTPCCEGEGPHPEYLDQIGNDNAEEELIAIKNGKLVKGDILALAVGTTHSRRRRRKNIVIVSDGLDESRVRTAKLSYFKDIQEAVDAAQAKYEDDHSVCVITHGGYTFAYVDPK